MPGQSHQGPPAPLPDGKIPLAVALEADVDHLTSFGPRNVNAPQSMDRSVTWLEAELGKAGLTTERHTFVVDQLDCHNVVASRQGSDRPEEIVLIGAHYDSVPTTIRCRTAWVRTTTPAASRSSWPSPAP